MAAEKFTIEIRTKGFKNANKSLQNLQIPSKVVKVAKVKNNNKSSPIKLASLRTKKEDK